MKIIKPKICQKCGHVFKFGENDGIMYNADLDNLIIYCSNCGDMYTETVKYKTE